MKKRILIVDDSEMMREFLAHQLNEKYETVVAASSEEAIRKLEIEFLPDLILTDYSMEGQSGLELLQHVKKSTELEHICVVVLSSKMQSKEKVNCLQAGADDYILKPFNPIELQLRIDKVLSQRRQSMSVIVSGEQSVSVIVNS